MTIKRAHSGTPHAHAKKADPKQAELKPSAKTAAPASTGGWVTKPSGGAAHPPASGFDPIGAAQKTASVVGKALDKEVLDGVDGYVAFDPRSSQFLAGDTGGVRLADDHLSWLLPKGLSTMLASGDGHEKVKLSLQGGAAIDSGSTNRSGFDPITVSELQQLGPKGLDPKRGGLLKIQVAAEGQTTEQRMLALPKNYDGPIFVSDIDDTLRPTTLTDVVAGTTQAPIAGAKELLQGVAAKGVPIIYLSAGPQRIGTLNDDFLRQMPEGVLLARQNMDVMGFSPRNVDQAKSQGDYKAQRLADLRANFPNAKIFGLGDDKYGDANAYTAVQAQAFIHDVRPGNDNIPANFSGTITKDYDAKFRATVLGALDSAIAGSDSFK